MSIRSDSRELPRDLRVIRPKLVATAQPQDSAAAAAISSIAIPVITEAGLECKSDFSEALPPLSSEPSPRSSSPEVLQYSQLDHLTQADLNPIVDAIKLFDPKCDAQSILRMAANTLGGGLITGGKWDFKLDGFHQLPNLTINKWLIEQIQASIDPGSQEYVVLQEMSDGLDRLIQYSKEIGELVKNPLETLPQKLSEFSEKYLAKVQALKPGETLTLCGGWGDAVEGGHAQIYEIIKRESGNYDVRLLTSTGFSLIDAFHGESHKERLVPRVEYQEVPGTEITAGFLQALIEPRALFTHYNNEKLTDKTIELIFRKLDQYRVPVAIEDCGIITGQRAGTCVSSVLKVWIREHANDLRLYKQIMFHSKYLLLVAVYKLLEPHLDKNTDVGEVARGLLTSCAENLLRRNVKALKPAQSFPGKEGTIPELVDSEVTQLTRATATDILERIEAYQTKIEKELTEWADPSKVSALNFERQRNNRADIQINSPGDKVERSLTSYPIVDVGVEKYDGTKQQFLKALDTTLNCLPKNGKITPSQIDILRIEKIAEMQPELYAQQIHLFLDSIPIPNSAQSHVFSQLTLEEKVATLEKMSQLLEYYSVGSIYGSDSLTRRYATGLPLYTLIHTLAVSIDNEHRNGMRREKSPRLAEYQLPSILESLEQSKYLLFLDGKEFHRINDSFIYWKSFEEAKKQEIAIKAISGEGGVKELFMSEAASEVVREKIKTRPGNGEYWNALIENDAELKTKLTAKIAAIRKEKNIPHHIPDVSLMVLACEDLTDRGIINELDYSYVDTLRRAIDSTRFLMNSSEGLRPFSLNSSSDYSKLQVKGSGDSETPSGTVLNTLPFSNQHPLTEQKHKDFLKLKVAGREQKSWKSNEAEAEALLKSDGLTPLLKKLKRTLGEWELSPDQILYEIGQDVNVLEDASLQSLVMRLFFRSPVIEEGIPGVRFGETKTRLELGAGNLIAEQSLFEKAVSFVRKGLISQENKREGRMKVGNFFFELSFYLCRHLVEKGQFEKAQELNLLSTVNQWATSNNKEEIAPLNLHRINFTSLLPPHERTTEHYADIFASWMLFKLNQSEGMERTLVDHGRDFVIRMASELNIKNNPKFSAEIGKLIADRLRSGGVAVPDGTWELSSELGFPYLTNKGWQLNIASGDVYGEEGLLSGTTTFPWENTNNFKRLFGENPKFKYQTLHAGKSEECFLFSDPKIGSFRLMKNPNILDSYLIQRKFDGHEGWWDLYVQGQSSIFRFNHVTFPKAITKDHAIWINKDSSAEIRAMVTTLREHKKAYVMDKQGKIQGLNQGEVQGHDSESPRDDIDCMDEHLYQFNLNGFNRFEELDRIITERKSDTNQIQSIRFPRYTLNDNELRFELIKDEKGHDQYVWSVNREFAIPERMQTSFLGTVKNYLHLKSLRRPGKEVLLIPFQKIIYTYPDPRPGGNLEISNDNPLIDSKDGSPRNEFWKTQQYFVLEVDGDQLKPTTKESQLFLAYIYLSQMNYERASHYLTKEMDPISPVGMKILEMIQAFELGTDHPDAKLIKFHALVKYIQAKDRGAEPVVDYFPGEALIEVMIQHTDNALDFLQSSQNISAGCQRIPDEILQVVLEKIVNEGKRTIPEDNIEAHRKLGHLEQRLKVWKNPGKRSLIVPAMSAALTPLKELKEKQGLVPREPIPANFKYQTKADREKVSLWLNTETYEEAVQERELSFNSLEEGVLSDQSIGHELYIRPSSYALLTNRNGVLFKHVYQIAKSNDETKRKDMIYRLTLWRENAPNNISIDPYVDCMLEILMSPHKYPPFPILLKDEGIESKKDKIRALLIAVSEVYLPASAPKESDSAAAAVAISKPAAVAIPEPAAKNRRDPAQSQRFPLPSQPSLQIQNPIIPISNGPFRCKFDPQDVRWGQLLIWKTKLIGKPRVTSKEPFPALDPGRFELKPEEAIFSESLGKDLEIIKGDYELGQKLNAQKVDHSLDAATSRQMLVEVKAQLKAVSEEKELRKKQLVTNVNKISSNRIQREIELARVGGKIISPITFEDCVSDLLEFKTGCYQLRNPNLLPLDVDQLATDTLTILDLQSYESQLKRTLNLIEEINSLDSVEAGNKADPVRRHELCQLLNVQLEAKYLFDDPQIGIFTAEEKIALRVFAGQTGIIPLSKQAKLLCAMLRTENADKVNDIVAQLIMGGGKTSVIATYLLFLRSKILKSTSCFILPPSLMEVVKANLGDSLFKAFGKEIIAINMENSSFTLHELTLTRDRMKEGRDRQRPVIIGASTLPILQLKLLGYTREITALLKERSKSLPQFHAKIDQSINELKEKGKVIEEILEIPKNALLDESDLLLDSKLETNYVVGGQQHVSETGSALLMSIYKQLISQDLSVDIPKGAPSRKLADCIGLQSNRQGLVNKEEFKRQVSPVVAKALLSGTGFDQFIQGIPKDHTDSFIRYVSGTMPKYLQRYVDRMPKENLDQYDPLPADISDLPGVHPEGYKLEQAKLDLAFLINLKKQHEGTDKTAKELVGAIALCKHFLNVLIPDTITKEGNRNYGQVKANPGEHTDLNSLTKIIPFLGNNMPATTEFGYHWEAACYYFQSVLANSLNSATIVEMAKIINSAAQGFASQYGENVEKSPEYGYFKEKFGVSIEKVLSQDPDTLKKAQENIAGDTEKLLEIQCYIINRFVTYAPERLSSNGFDLISLLDSAQAMSGTPWSREGWIARLQKLYEPDAGSEGSIIDVLRTKVTDNKILAADLSIRDGQPATIRRFLEDMHKQMGPQFKRVRALIDTAGTFKPFKSHKDVAKGWLDYIIEQQGKEQKEIDGGKRAPADRTVDPNIEAVLFFHTSGNQTQPNTLFVWRKGQLEATPIDDPSAEGLAKIGLTPDKYMVYYDEGHVTGVDAAHIADAIAIQTFGHQATRDVLQSAMRMRKLAEGQEIYFAIDNEIRPSLTNQGKNFDSLLQNAIKVQTLRKAEAMVRYFNQQITHVTSKMHAVKSVRNSFKEFISGRKSNEDFVKEVETLEPFFVSRMKEDPYAVHGRLEDTTDTKAMLQQKLKDDLDVFSKKCLDPAAIQAARKDAAELQKLIADTKSLPTRCPTPLTEIGMEQEVQMQVQAQKEIKVEVEVETELQQYRTFKVGEPFKEDQMSLEGFMVIIKHLKSPESQAAVPIIKLTQRLQDYRDDGKGYDKEYHKVFNQEIYGTDTFFNPCISRMNFPVFHQAQRPPSQIVAVRVDNNFKWLLVSDHEAQSVYKYIDQLTKQGNRDIENVWLIDLDGGEYIKRSVVHQSQHCPGLEEKSNQDERKHAPEISPSMSSDNEFNVNEPEVKAGLIELNAFAGNVRYLAKDQNSGEFDDWLAKHPAIAVRFLKLKSAPDEAQTKYFQSSPMIANALGMDISGVSSNMPFMCKERLELEQKRIGTYKPESVMEVKCLQTPRLLRNLHSDCIPDLGIDVTRDDPDTLAAIAQLRGKGQGVYDFDDHNRVQVRFLRQSQITKLTSAQHYLYKYLDQRSQIQAVRSDLLHHIDSTMAKHLTNEQIEGITKEMLNTHPHFFKELMNNMEESQRKILITKYVKSFSKEIIDCPLPLVSEIPSFTNIQGPIPIDWVPWISGKGIASLSQLSHSGFDDRHVEHLIKSQYKHLDSKWYYCLSTEQIKKMDQPDELNKLSIDRIGELDVSQLKLITRDDLISSIPKEKVQHLAHSQLNKIIRAQAEGLIESQIQGINDQNLFNKIPLAKITEYLTEIQVPLLMTAEQVKACPEKFIDRLRGQQLKYIKPEWAPRVADAEVRNITDPLVIKHLDDSQLKHITLDYLIRLIPKDKVQHLVNSQLSNITNEQVEGLIGSQIAGINDRDLFNEIPVEKLSENLTEMQVPLLFSREQVMACPEKLIDKLRGQQLKYIKPEWAPLVADTEVKYIKDRLAIQHLEKRQFAYTSEWSVFLASQLQTLDSSEELNQVPNGRLSDLNEDQVKLITDRALITYMPLDMIKYLIPQQIQYLSKWKAERLTQDQISQLNTVEQLKVLNPFQHKLLSPEQEVLLGLIPAPQPIPQPEPEPQPIIEPVEPAPIKPTDLPPFIIDEPVIAPQPAPPTPVVIPAPQPEPMPQPVVVPVIAPQPAPPIPVVIPAPQPEPVVEPVTTLELTDENIIDILVKHDKTTEELIHGKALLGRITVSNASLLLPLIDDVEFFAKIQSATIAAVDPKVYNGLKAGHPLWKCVSYEKLKSISKDRWKDVDRTETLDKVPMRQYVHLKTDQLAKEKRWFVPYLFGCMTLGILATVFAVLSYVFVYPFFKGFGSKEKQKQFRATVDPNIRRLSHLFTDYCPALIR